MAVKNSVEHIPLDRRICIIREDRIDIRPSRGAIIVPLVGALVSLIVFLIVGLTIDLLPVVALALLLIPGVIIFPLSVMGLFYSLVGAHVIVDRRRGLATFQQGLLGLGVGTREVVPFGKVDCIAVEEVAWGEGESRPVLLPFELRAWDVVLVKTDGKRLPVGMAVAPREEELVVEGLGRARQVAEAIGEKMGRPVKVEDAMSGGAKD
jgi:hypothetical protein